MKIALRCEKCRVLYMAAEDSLCLEMDFFTKKISFVCPQCKHNSILDLNNYQKNQKESPLPRIKIC